MAAQSQGTADYFVWQVPGNGVAIHLNMDVLERISREVMRGFAAVPRRGAEVGGILLGSFEPALVRIDDFEPIESRYRHGPSYLLDDEDRRSFEQASQRWNRDQSPVIYAVGYYRSHTREGMSLAPEDIRLLDEYFPSSQQVALLIKPFATKPSLAGFFVREDGVFPPATPAEFPFRRRDLPISRSGAKVPQNDDKNHQNGLKQRENDGKFAYFGRRSAAWVPLSFIFLLLGVVLGLMIAMARGPGFRGQDFSLGLSVSRANDNLNVHWNREAAVIGAAARGVLEIQDGPYNKPVDLDTAQLRNGSIIYRNSSDTVRFRLVVYPDARVSVAQTAEWRR